MTDGVDIKLERGINLSTKISALKAMGPKLVLKAANHAGGEIARSVYAKHGGGSGALARSFLPASFVSAPNGQVAAGAFSDLVYAEVQDQGGTIEPKSGKNLAIPIGAKRTDVRWPRDYPKDSLKFIMAKGKKLLVEKVGKGKDFVVRFVLKPSVKITGSGYLAAAASAAEPGIEKILQENVDEALDAG